MTRILVVEPEARIARDLGDRLTKMGHTVTATAARGEQAIEAARATRPDLVFMSTTLEGVLSGAETARRLRRARDVPVVYLATAEEASAIPKDSEPFGHVLKTFNDGELHAAIEFALYRHRIDAKLLTVERWLSTTLLSIGDAVIATDRNGHISLINAVAQRLTGWTEAQAVGRHFNDVFRIVDGETRQPIVDIIDRALMHGFSIGMDDNVWLQPLDGIEIAIDDSIAPIRGENMHVTGVVIVFRDGTARKRAELAGQLANQHLERQVQQRTQELEAANDALEAFSGSVSHDLRAPLRAVSGFSSLLSERYAGVLDAEGRRFLEIIQAKSAQMARMIEDFIRLSHLRQAPLQVTPLDSDAMLREIVADLAQEQPAARAIVVEPLPGFDGDEGLMRQVWVNLLGNALKFTARCEQPHIRVSADESGGMVNFHVVDNGVGFDMAHATRLFSPFQRLHAERDFDGHGIGLATVARVIERHKGSIRAEGQVNRGAAFHFSVPRTAAAISA